MEIRSLEQVTLPAIVDCLVESFADYLVTLPSDVLFWENKFKGARVDYKLSFGVFDDKRLIAFIVNGIDFINGRKVAFNTGTGVLLAHRGNRWVDKLYEFSIPILKSVNVESCELEVITGNHRAIRVYERIGFSAVKLLKCFKGTITPVEREVFVVEVDFETIASKQIPGQTFWSWDNCSDAIRALNHLYTSFEVGDRQGHKLGYFVMNLSSGYIAQCGLYEPEKINNWSLLFAGIAQKKDEIKINNVDELDNMLCEHGLLKNGLENYINQHLMRMEI